MPDCGIMTYADRCTIWRRLGANCGALVVAVLMNDVAPAVAWVRWFVPPLMVTLVLDQVTKEWLFAQFAKSAAPDLPRWIELSHNTGVAWGMGNSMPMVVVLVTALLIPLLSWVWWKRPCISCRTPTWR